MDGIAILTLISELYTAVQRLTAENQRLREAAATDPEQPQPDDRP